jgi:hypothetical protein
LTVLSFSDLANATKQKQVRNVSIEYPQVLNPQLFQPQDEEPAGTPSSTP